MSEEKRYYIISNKLGVKMLLDNPQHLDSNKIVEAGTMLLNKRAFTVIYDPNWVDSEIFVIAGAKVFRLKIIE